MVLNLSMKAGKGFVRYSPTPVFKLSNCEMSSRVCGVKVCWMSSRVCGGMSSRVCGDTVNIASAPGPDPLILNLNRLD